MSYSYSAGSTTPNYAGLVEFNGIRINDGTFILTALKGVLDGAPAIRAPRQSFSSSHGGHVGTPYYEPVDIVLEGQLVVSAVADIWPAKDQLRGAFNLSNTSFQTMTINTSGWSAERQMLVRVSGAVTFEEPELFDKLKPQRDFQIPLVAQDPLMYSTTTTTTTITLGGSGTLTTVTTAGTAPTPFTARFTGPMTGGQLVLNATGNPQIYLGTGVTIAAGQWIEVTTNQAAPGGITAKWQDGSNAYPSITGGWTVYSLPVGSSQWFVNSSGTTGASSVTITRSDAWA